MKKIFEFEFLGLFCNFLKSSRIFQGPNCDLEDLIAKYLRISELEFFYTACTAGLGH